MASTITSPSSEDELFTETDAAFPIGSSLQSLAGRSDIKFYVEYLYYMGTDFADHDAHLYVVYKNKFYETNVTMVAGYYTGLTSAGEKMINNYDYGKNYLIIA